ncbi:hypothetical protein [Frigoribacterium sp. PvP032]|uniref:hypothetical protein n=1 Tax=Frigoribacterium sp. PvP032 TaxID=2806589 RepID=UPI001AEA0543|nr:hypothetical protein [Frigoribacterium sp. PvP032]MBP1189014.1 hypothetical protein [Frigoribacterium sp. PvP032]
MTTSATTGRAGRATRAARAVTTVAATALMIGALAGCGERDDPVVTPTPSPVSPTATPEPATPEPSVEVPVTTDKPTDRQTIPPQN